MPAAMPAAAYCSACGRPAAECAGCARTLDPPRYCGACGGWMGVRVTPGGWVARCREHGEVTSGGPGH
jgi:hypothetical protein